MADLSEEAEEACRICKDLDTVKDFKAVEDKDIEKEMAGRIEKLEKDVGKQETKAFLSGKYDKGSAVIEISSGAGGVDAQDWTAMLFRMYERYCSNKGFETKVINCSYGEGVGPEGRIGIKSVSFEVKGRYAYGFLKKESGIHRLVRQSPFSAKDLRHTSFASVQVMPEIEKEDEIELKPEDLRIDVFRSSGPGGQNVNKRETAVRITHLPTGIAVASQSERLQGTNKENAMRILYSKLYLMKEEEKKEELKKIKGGQVSASWGNQIRSYVLHPYKMVKDLRTQIETSDAESVLDGNINRFIESEIKLNDISKRSD